MTDDKPTFRTFLEAQDGIRKAHEFAKRAHQGQTRKFSGLPYFVHPESVAGLVQKYSGNSELTQAAYLHDTLEDTETSYDQIVQEFSRRVADLVVELSHNITDKSQKGKILAKHMSKMSDGALTIKLCDRLDNVSDERASQRFKDRYYAETEYILNNLKRSLNATQKKIVQAIKEKIGML